MKIYQANAVIIYLLKVYTKTTYLLNDDKQEALLMDTLCLVKEAVNKALEGEGQGVLLAVH